MPPARSRATLNAMTAWHGTGERRPRVVIAGGGVAALEACLLLRAHVSADDVDIDLVAPAPHFSYRPLSVLEPFGGAPAWSMPLERFAGDQDVTLVPDGLARVLPHERAILTTSGARRAYDLLLVAVGAIAAPDLPGATTFRGSAETGDVRRILDEASGRLRPRLAFAVGTGASWPLPLYELALLTAAELRGRGTRAEISIVTPEAAPLEMFGPRASDLVARLLGEHGIGLVPRAEPTAVADCTLRLADGRALGAEHVVALPRAAGRFLEHLPHDAGGFIPVDGHGRVAGVDGVYAAGDITAFPFKQGGIATQQADAAAEAMLADLGLPIAPQPFTPVLQGVLFTGAEPAFMRRPLGAETALAPRTYSLWWPPSKIAGRLLSSYLTVRAGAPRAPEIRPAADVVPVSVDVSGAGVPRPRTPAAC
jgi:sulfide:quinone oxidoreductase